MNAMVESHVLVAGIPAIFWGTDRPRRLIAVHGFGGSKGDETIRLLARRAGKQSRQMSNIAAQLHQQAKQLSTAYFLQSGVRYWPVAQLTRPRMTTYVGGLRQLYQRGQALTEEFHSCRSHAATQDLAQLYAQLTQAGEKRCALLRSLLEQTHM